MMFNYIALGGFFLFVFMIFLQWKICKNEKTIAKKNIKCTDNIFDKWAERLECAQIGHYGSSEFYDKLSTGLNSFSVIATIIILFFSFYNPDDDISTVYIFVNRVLCVGAAISSIWMFVLNPSEKAELHRIQGARYGDMKREVERCKEIENSDDRREMLRKINEKWAEVASNSPITYFRFIQKG